MKIKSQPAEIAPKGKRTIKRSVWGNTKGYIGGRFWIVIGITHAAGTDEDAAEFLKGEER